DRAGTAAPVLTTMVAARPAARPRRARRQLQGLSDAFVAAPAGGCVGNALAGRAPGTAVRGATRTVDGIFELTASNQGEPIPPEAVTRLFFACRARVGTSPRKSPAPRKAR